MGKFCELLPSEVSEFAGNLLVARLPKSALLYNVTQLYLNTKMNDVVPTKFYAYNGNLDGEDAFVLAKQDKKRYQNSVTWTMCGPDAKYVVSDMFKAFEQLVDWTIPNLLPAVHVDISDGITDLCRKHGISPEWGPNPVYWRRGDEKNIKDGVSSHSLRTNKDVAIVDLDTETDGVKKLVQYWEHASESTYSEVLETVEFVSSAGVKVDGELVAWAFTSTDGAIHALFTSENHRGKGYSKLLLHSLSEMLARKGMHAITEVEGDNLVSSKLQLSAGFKFAYSMYWVEYTPNSSDLK